MLEVMGLLTNQLPRNTVFSYPSDLSSTIFCVPDRVKIRHGIFDRQPV